ncbi:hypothetical protein EPUS_00150 [Endocarpon pusillum Z07020]|uniref:Uncharacterized protein n=1 Tax=Endocarpon pusillum (strain Z07020 / HMAS-L-300199) TaxID=1263415 RepID=U1GCP4_ENDPU|nr:uncharacterized protein EPUS_00150 [Endocarpon pusillum Z07020]ERF75357.1 hypothetical protein EPUS_00150 [Endocarpon pusillum Z07020]
MAGIRDPAFWRRFSLAVHLDEEKANPSHTHGAASPASLRPELKHSHMARTKPEEAIENGVHWVVGLAEPGRDHCRHRAGHIMAKGQLASSTTRANLYLGANTDSHSHSHAAGWCMMKRYQ